MPNYIYDQDSGELYHYGVLGMKWGVRKQKAQLDVQTARYHRGGGSKGNMRRALDSSKTSRAIAYDAARKRRKVDKKLKDVTDRAKEKAERKLARADFDGDTITNNKTPEISKRAIRKIEKLSMKSQKLKSLEETAKKQEAKFKNLMLANMREVAATTINGTTAFIKL